MIKKINFTPEGYKNLVSEKAALTEKRKSVVAEVKRTRDMGDLSENAAYRAAKRALGGVDSRLRALTYQIDHATVVERGSIDTVELGCTVTVEHDKNRITYQLVGGYEADPLSGKITERSPLGKSLLGKRVHDEVLVHTPSGFKTYRIISIS